MPKAWVPKKLSNRKRQFKKYFKAQQHAADAYTFIQSIEKELDSEEVTPMRAGKLKKQLSVVKSRFKEASKIIKQLPQFAEKPLKHPTFVPPVAGERRAAVTPFVPLRRITDDLQQLDMRRKHFATSPLEKSNAMDAFFQQGKVGMGLEPPSRMKAGAVKFLKKKPDEPQRVSVMLKVKGGFKRKVIDESTAQIMGFLNPAPFPKLQAIYNEVAESGDPLSGKKLVAMSPSMAKRRGVSRPVDSGVKVANLQVGWVKGKRGGLSRRTKTGKKVYKKRGK